VATRTTCSSVDHGSLSADSGPTELTSGGDAGHPAERTLLVSMGIGIGDRGAGRRRWGWALVTAVLGLAGGEPVCSVAREERARLMKRYASSRILSDVELGSCELGWVVFGLRTET
jgi:hypothetical protein